MQRTFEELLPHQGVLAALATVCVVFLAPGLVYALGFRFQLRRDRREDKQSVGELMARLAKMQADELTRLAEVARIASQQVELLSNGRYRMQAAVERLHDELIAARVLAHDYERRLGLPETAFPPLVLPTFAAPSTPPQSSLNPV